ITKIFETGAKYQALVEYLHSETIPEDVLRNQLQYKDWISVVDAFVVLYNSFMHEAYGHTLHKILQVQQLVNALLDKDCAELYNQDSVHKNKSPNNTIKARTMIIIASDYDTNQKTQKQKL
ncbi:17738_t:CDS:2, partial [Cetraspora pellucida]